MTDYIAFQQALLSSLSGVKDSFEKANQLDLQNGGEDFSYDAAYRAVFDYVIKGNGGEGATMKDFIENLLESAHKKNLPQPESMIGAKDFAKKTFLVIMSTGIIEKIV